MKNLVELDPLRDVLMLPVKMPELKPILNPAIVSLELPPILYSLKRVRCQLGLVMKPTVNMSFQAMGM
jgi:hypothetical protein